MLWLRWIKLSTLQNVLGVILKWRVCFHSPYALCPGRCLRINVLENDCFVWYTVMRLKIEHKHHAVLRGLVLNVHRFFLSSPFCLKKRKQGYVRTPSCCLPDFKEMLVWNWSWFRPVFKRKYKVPSGLQCVLYFLQVFSLAVMEVPNLWLSAVVDSLCLVLIPANCYVCVSFHPHMASVVILRDCVSWCVFRGHLLDIFSHC